jgi:hypothetical protein
MQNTEMESLSKLGRLFRWRGSGIDPFFRRRRPEGADAGDSGKSAQASFFSKASTRMPDKIYKGRG